MDKHEIFTVKQKMKLDKSTGLDAKSCFGQVSTKKVTDKSVQMELGQEQLDISESLMRDLQKPGLEQSEEVRMAGC